MIHHPSLEGLRCYLLRLGTLFCAIGVAAARRFQKQRQRGGEWQHGDLQPRVAAPRAAEEEEEIKTKGTDTKNLQHACCQGLRFCNFSFFFVAQRSMEMQASGVCAAAVLLLSTCLIFSAQVRQFFFVDNQQTSKNEGKKKKKKKKSVGSREDFSLIWTRVCVFWFWWLNLAVRSDLTSNSDRMDLASRVRVSRRAVQFYYIL